MMMIEEKMLDIQALNELFLQGMQGLHFQTILMPQEKIDPLFVCIHQP